MPGHEVGGRTMRRLRTDIPRRTAGTGEILRSGWHGDRQPNTCTLFCRNRHRKGAHWHGYGSRCSPHLGRNHRKGLSRVGHLAWMAWYSSRIEDLFISRADIPKIPHTNRLCPPNRSLAPTPSPDMARSPMIHLPRLVVIGMVRMMRVSARRWSPRMRPTCASTPRGGRVRPPTARVGLRLRVRSRVRICIRTRLRKLDTKLAPQRLGLYPHPEALPTPNLLASVFCRIPQRTLPAPALAPTPLALTSAAQPTAGKLPPLLPELVHPLALGNHAFDLRPRIRSAW